MKELPQKIKQPEERTMHGTLVVTHLSPTELKINELIEYLESQKEGEDDCLCHLGEPPKKGCINYKEEPKCSCAIDNVGGNCKWCKEEPKQLDVEGLLDEYYECKRDNCLDQYGRQISGLYARNHHRMEAIINTLKQSLQQ